MIAGVTKVKSTTQNLKFIVNEVSFHNLSLISAGQLETMFQCCSSDISDSPKVKADITFLTPAILSLNDRREC